MALVKICGVTTEAAVKAAQAGGAAFVGFAFFEKSPRNIVSWVNQLTIVGFVVILIYLGMKVSLKELHTFGYSTRIPMFWPYLAIPVGCFMNLIQLLYILKMLFKNESPPLGY